MIEVIHMKYYIVESIAHTFEYNVRVYTNDIEDFCATIHANLLRGYCCCLEHFGYEHITEE